MNQRFLKEMLIYCVLQEISAQWQKRGFAIAYKSSSYMLDLAALPWAARKRRINQRFLKRDADLLRPAIKSDRKGKSVVSPLLTQDCRRAILHVSRPKGAIHWTYGMKSNTYEFDLAAHPWATRKH